MRRKVEDMQKGTKPRNFSDDGNQDMVFRFSALAGNEVLFLSSLRNDIGS